MGNWEKMLAPNPGAALQLEQGEQEASLVPE